MREAEERAYILRLAKRLPPRERLRAIALDLLDGRPLGRADTAIVHREALSPRAGRWRPLTLALWALNAADLEEAPTDAMVSSACAILEGRGPTDVRSLGLTRAIASGVGLAAGFAGAVTVFIVLAQLSTGELGPPLTGLRLGGYVFACAVLPSILLALPTIIPLSIARDRKKLMAARVYAARLLGRWRLPEAAGPLARATEHGNRRLRDAARAALWPTLAGMRGEDYGRVSARDQQSLLSLIREGDEAHAMAVLNALGKVGGGVVADGVREIARSAAVREAARERGIYLPQVPAFSREVCEAAQRVVPAIEERARKERDGSTLVRAAATAPAAPALLRPAGSAETGAEALLRSVNEDGSLE